MSPSASSPGPSLESWSSEVGGTTTVPAGVTRTETNVGWLAPAKVTRPMYEPASRPSQLSVTLPALPLASRSGFGLSEDLPTTLPSTAASTDALVGLLFGLAYRLA